MKKQTAAFLAAVFLSVFIYHNNFVPSALTFLTIKHLTARTKNTQIIKMVI